ncbi:similar to An12g01300 [Aspergillus luchuensis]|uniref:Similar to An12g01300 n=1 Tax=Aspergillus kawachii TaxID=1069201 RepID=A0A146FQ51_ASPKA|nr:similar to An12g01300 [Aspergillus luchuensis]
MVISMRTGSRLPDSMEAVSTEGTSGVLIIHHFAEGIVFKSTQVGIEHPIYGNPESRSVFRQREVV